MSNTAQSKAYHVRTLTGGAWRKIGTFFRADFQAPEVLRGKYVFLRFVKKDYDLCMHRTQSNGFSTAVFEHVKADGALYMLTYSRESGKMIVGHVDAYVQTVIGGQGHQTHASLQHCETLPPGPCLNFPVAIDTITIQDEQPSNVDIKPVAVQPSLIVEQKPVKSITKRCGCYFEDGTIVRPCLTHKAQWEPVMRAKTGA